ncbi:hypothetical protein QJR30_11070 [Paraclostridium sordellii]|nr:hypothetical protein [Paeniclostridium sordellii]CEP81031.1 Uncharacterised protein [[Clostridium] sordellii] [Paeniclostridium sordellii]
MRKYKDEEFEHPELGKLAKDYIDGLNKQEEALKYYISDIVKCDKLWTK